MRVSQCPVTRDVLPDSQMTKRSDKADPYAEKVREHWEAITGMYRAFDEHAPIVEFNVDSGRVIAWPAEDYIDELTERTREQTRKLYRQAVAEGALMVFVRDAEQEVLRSYVFPPAEERAEET